MENPDKDIPERFDDELEELNVDELLALAKHARQLAVSKRSRSEKAPSLSESKMKEIDDETIAPWKQYFKAKKRRQELLFREE